MKLRTELTALTLVPLAVALALGSLLLWRQSRRCRGIRGAGGKTGFAESAWIASLVTARLPEEAIMAVSHAMVS